MRIDRSAQPVARQTTKFWKAPSLLAVGAVLLLTSRTSEPSITLMLAQPEYLPCGDVSISGYVGTSSGVIQRMSWEWGDGSTNDHWLPA